MVEAGGFIFCTCQVGAETALKHEFARRWPQCQPAFLRPGFVTFRLAPGFQADERGGFEPIFARAWGHVLGKAMADEIPEAVREIWSLAGDRPYRALHVFHRDQHPPGRHGYEPNVLPEDKQLAALLRAERPELALPALAGPGWLALDCVCVDPGLYWVGCHEAHSAPSCWPGGFSRFALPKAAVSRAWLKMEEALRWADFPLRPGQHCAEIGSAPGGSSQALLQRGLIVTGIDPAEMHPTVLAHPNFRHLRKRGADVRRREFRKTRWLTVDMNVAPQYALDTVEDVVTHPEVRIRGLLLTLKLLDWELAEHIPEYLFRIRTWGFKQIKARQLHHNRQEICVAAQR